MSDDWRTDFTYVNEIGKKVTPVKGRKYDAEVVGVMISEEEDDEGVVEVTTLRMCLSFPGKIDTAGREMYVTPKGNFSPVPSDRARKDK